MNELIVKVSHCRTHLEKLNWLPPLLARITLGWVFVMSGWGKLQHMPKVIDFFTSLELPAPDFLAHLVAFSELFCGVLIFLGLLSRLASIPLSIIMIVAILTAKWPDLKEFSDLFKFSEFLYLLLFVWIVIEGPGKVSLDYITFKKR